MNLLPVVCAVLAVPAAWVAGVLIDRVPDRLALWPPPGLRVHGRYLAVEVVMVVTFVALGFRFESRPALVVITYLLLAMVLVALSAIDIALFRLPDRIVVPSLVVGVILVSLESLRAGQPHRIGYALAGAGIYFGILLVFHLISPRGMGFGDVKLAALMGLGLGWLAAGYGTVFVLVIWGLGVGAVGASVVGMVLLAVQGMNRRTPIPFGPYLAFGTLLVVALTPHLVTLTLSA